MDIKIPTAPWKCTCRLCASSRKFRAIANKLDYFDQEWMMGFLDYVVNLEEDNGMLEMWVDDLRKERDVLKLPSP